MRLVFLFIFMNLAAISSVRGQDLCVRNGEIANMLLTVRNTCPASGLTVSGEQMLDATLRSIIPLGGPSCVEHGKKMMLAKAFLVDSRLTQAMEKMADTPERHRKITGWVCDFIIKQLRDAAQTAGLPPLTK